MREVAGRETTRFLAPGLYPWWVAGVGFSSLLLPLAVSAVLPQSGIVASWFFALGSAIVFLSCLDSQGSFRPWRMVAAIALLVLIYKFLPSPRPTLPPRLVLGMLTAALLFYYGLAGAIGVFIGRAVKHEQP